MAKTQPRKPSESDLLLLWVAMLHQARLDGDFLLVREATRRLTDLGIVVSFRPIGRRTPSRRVAREAGGGVEGMRS